ncbi:MAG: hypothetical protein GC129_01485 [Proteobacteria bacterium]|nr:hypothetical protein [Pseudomonadota bacterium]
MPETLNAQQLRVLAGCWDLRRGDHPHLARHLTELANQKPFPGLEEWQSLAQLDLPLTLTAHGHHILQDATYLHAANPAQLDEWPLAPVFVRDLAGRVIHTGLLPLPTPPATPIFPAGCEDITIATPGAELVENAIFTTYRRAEIAPAAGVQLAGQSLQLRAVYPQPVQTPYKLRPDTFYQDGWRLPQTTRLFAKQVDATLAQKSAQSFTARWHKRPKNQPYEEFYESNGGAAWYEELFLQGVTIIPTLEAYNGIYQVGEDYRILGVEAGRAVSGLHQVVNQQDSPEPAGTILDVVQPGYVTTAQVFPAQVVVSNGAAYNPAQAPQPMLPNLSLPHPRVAAVWGAVWLPTHPAHFVEPALWDWDAGGHFVQISGPLWDPVHYTYASTQSLVRAARHPVADNPFVFTLPEAMKQRFYPAIAQNWYDTINERTGQERSKDYTHPLYGSALDSLPLGQTVATLGYHPLPAGLEYELDPAVFPNLHPHNRVGACPAALQSRLVPLAKLAMEESQLSRHHVVVGEPLREALRIASQAPVQRGAPSGAEGDVALQANAMAAPAWLPEINASQLFINVKRLFANRLYRQNLQQRSPTLSSALFRFREAGLAWRRLRYRLFVKYPAIWVQAWAQGVDLSTAEGLLAQITPEQHALVTLARAKSVTVVPLASNGVPAGQAGGLRLGRAPSKLASSQPQPRP